MPKVIADITMSLDGYVTGPGADPDHGLGDAESSMRGSMTRTRSTPRSSNRRPPATGAVVMGRRLFDVVNGPTAGPRRWGTAPSKQERPRSSSSPIRPPDDVRLERELGLRLTFVDGVAAAVDQARTAATDGHVVIMGGGDVIGQAIEAGPRRRAAPAPRTDAARWRNSAVSGGHAPDVPPT